MEDISDMIKLDLVTGFLGSGKTTFIRKYVEHLNGNGTRVGIIENDFGAINVDMLLLQDMESELCDIEPIVGGNVVSDWKRRFKAKLISLSMQGFDRVVVEPSGIYDVEAFFDVLYDEPVNSWYEVGNIFTIVDVKLDERLSGQAEYLMVSQLANCGQVVLSKVSEKAANEDTMECMLDADGKGSGNRHLHEQQIRSTIQELNNMLAEHDCDRTIDDVVMAKDWETLTGEDYYKLLNCGWHNAAYKKAEFDKNDVFKSLFFMNIKLPTDEIKTRVEKLLQDESRGTIFRVKGFFRGEDGSWLEVNATKEHMELEPVKVGQEVVIVIGQDLDEQAIREALEGNNG